MKTTQIDRRVKSSKIIKTGRNFKASNRLWERGSQLIPCGTQTLSKCPGQHAKGISPKYLQKGKGCYVIDVDGNRYLDYSMGILPITLGYAYGPVDRAVQSQLKQGITFSLMHPLEVELAEKLKKIIPCAEMVRYGKNGSDVTTAAIRLARAYTGREKVICCGYHGWHDWYIATTTRNAGVPEEVKKLSFKFPYNDSSALKKIFESNPKDIAAVILEPVDFTAPNPGFLEEVKEIAHRFGAVLIFDEIKTGFRIALAGMQEYSGVTPDLATFGKAIANGMPLSVLTGKREIMKEFDRVFFSFTFGGETLSLAAAMAVIREYEEKGVIGYLWRIGKRLQDGYNELAKKHGILSRTKCGGLPPMNGPVFLDETGKNDMILKTLFQQETIKHGILFRDRHNISFSHKDKEVDFTLKVYDQVLAVLRKAIESDEIKKFLEVPVIEEIFPSHPGSKR